MPSSRPEHTVPFKQWAIEQCNSANPLCKSIIFSKLKPIFSQTSFSLPTASLFRIRPFDSQGTKAVESGFAHLRRQHHVETDTVQWFPWISSAKPFSLFFSILLWTWQSSLAQAWSKNERLNETFKTTALRISIPSPEASPGKHMSPFWVSLFSSLLSLPRGFGASFGCGPFSSRDATCYFGDFMLQRVSNSDWVSCLTGSLAPEGRRDRRVHWTGY